MRNLLLPENEIHIYKASIGFLDNLNGNEFFSLSHDEKKQVKDYVHSDDRKRFVLGRYITRNILRRYTGKCFDSRNFEYNDYKKPKIKESGENIEFNIAHSEQIVLVAFSRKPVGIDIEIERKLDSTLVNDLVFTQKELGYLHSLKREEELREVFLRIWTNKEAYMKGVGKGFYLSANTIEVKFGKKFNKIIDLDGNIQEEFILKDIDEVNFPYKASVAFTNKNMNIKVKDFKII